MTIIYEGPAVDFYVFDSFNDYILNKGGKRVFFDSSEDSDVHSSVQRKIGVFHLKRTTILYNSFRRIEKPITGIPPYYLEMDVEGGESDKSKIEEIIKKGAEEYNKV